MAAVSVAQAAERIGSQWVVDERSLLRVQERSKAGRPYSARSAWAVIAASEDDRDRADRRLLHAAPADLVDLGVDDRWAVVVDLGASGVASAEVEGYLAESEVDEVVKDYLLVDAERDENVVLHVVPDGQYPFPRSRLRLAADLAEHRGPREEARAAELLHELALERKVREW